MARKDHWATIKSSTPRQSVVRYSLQGSSAAAISRWHERPTAIRHKDESQGQSSLESLVRPAAPQVHAFGSASALLIRSAVQDEISRKYLALAPARASRSRAGSPNRLSPGMGTRDAGRGYWTTSVYGEAKSLSYCTPGVAESIMSQTHWEPHDPFIPNAIQLRLWRSRDWEQSVSHASLHDARRPSLEHRSHGCCQVWPAVFQSMQGVHDGLLQQHLNVSA